MWVPGRLWRLEVAEEPFQVARLDLDETHPPEERNRLAVESSAVVVACAVTEAA
jgi:hypothetical protein